MGLSYVTEERSVFKGLSARDNLRCGGVEPEDGARDLPRAREAPERARRPAVGRRAADAHARPRALPQAAAAAGRRAVARPRSAHRRAAAAGGAVGGRTARGTGVVIVEQHARKALKYADRVLVLSRGRVRMALSAEEARGQLADIEAHYLSGATLGRRDGRRRRRRAEAALSRRLRRRGRAQSAVRMWTDMAAESSSSQPPPFWVSATRAPSTWRVAGLAAQLPRRPRRPARCRSRRSGGPC